MRATSAKLEAELKLVVTEFVTEMSSLARAAARDMAHQALNTMSVARTRARASKRSNEGPPADAFDRLLDRFRRGARPNLANAVSAFEWQYIARMLADNDGNITRAANALGVAGQGLQRKIQRLRTKDRRRRSR